MKFTKGHHTGHSYCEVLGIAIEVELFWNRIKVGTHTEYYCDPDSSYPDDVYCCLVEQKLPEGIDEVSAQALARELFSQYLEDILRETLVRIEPSI